MFNKVLLLSFLTFLITDVSYSSEVNIQNLLTNLKKNIEVEISSIESCTEELQKTYKQFYKIKPQDAPLNEMSKSELNKLVNQSFGIRLLVKEKITEYASERELKNNKCFVAAQNVTRVLRYLEDYLLESLYLRNISPLQKSIVTLSSEDGTLLVNPKFKGQFNSHKDLRSGDIILSRGNAYSSAAIARIGKVDTHFSHLSLVYKNPHTKELSTVEAHIEIGVVHKRFKFHLASHNAREVVYRFKDPAMAHKAATLMKSFVDQYKRNYEKNIPYDFGMDFSDDSEIFCSEVVYKAFNMASEGRIDVPRYKSNFKRGTLPFLQMLGIDVDNNNIDQFETFAPGDIELDPRFELVADWRNPLKSKENRIKDVVLSSIFKWMGKNEYRFRVSYMKKFKSVVGWGIRRTRLAYEEDFPLNMGTEQMQLVMVLDQLGGILAAKIKEAQYKSRSTLTIKDMFEVLESYRVEDLNRHLKRRDFIRTGGVVRGLFSGKIPFVSKHPKESDFHQIFSPLE
jgi:hypothetical protein